MAKQHAKGPFSSRLVQRQLDRPSPAANVHISPDQPATFPRAQRMIE